MKAYKMKGFLSALEIKSPIVLIFAIVTLIKKRFFMAQVETNEMITLTTH